MHLDVIDLRAFYYRTRLGRAAKAALQEALGDLWQDAKGQTVVGFGFATPFLRPFLKDARRVISLMPGQQGVMPWPTNSPNLCCLVEETNWPISAGTVDKLIIAHGLETCERPDALLSEIWRVLAPGGSVIFIVPNRAGLWAQRDGTPFGFGRPYSLGQLEAQLKKHRFYPERQLSALYLPPSEKRFWMRTHKFWETVGRRLQSKLMAGALVIEASKQIYVRPKGGAAESIKRPLEVLEGLTKPKPEPVRGRSWFKAGRAGLRKL